MRRSLLAGAGTASLLAVVGLQAAEAEPRAAESFRTRVEPLLTKYCYDCHGAGIRKGGVALDEFTSAADLLSRHSLWWAALKNLRAGLMPPREDGVAPPTEEEIQTIARWIKYEAFAINPDDPDPGRVSPRRLNRIEYRNTIRDLMGYDFNSEVEFPPDDSGSGFDNNGDVLTLSPLLLEKYLAAAETIVEKAVPKVSREMPERIANGREFRAANGPGSGDQLNARRAVTVARTFNVEHEDRYRVLIELETRGSFDFDSSRCRLVGRIDGEEKFAEEIAWSERRTLRHEFEVAWRPGKHVVSFEVVPRSEGGAGEAGAEAAAGTIRPQNVPGPTSVTMRINSVTVRGPLSPEHWSVPQNHARFFPRGAAPADPAARDRYAAELLGQFATRAYRRPVEPRHVEHLVELARPIYSTPGRTFEEGIGRAMMAVLVSPRFLFRLERPVAGSGGGRSVLLDEYSLASRLSYSLWSTMPDDELLGLARRGDLRRHLPAQLRRMLADSRAQAFVRNFTGQWLQARDVESVPINVRAALGPGAPRNRDGRVEFDGAFRRLMRTETEMYFGFVVREDRSLLELVDSDYAFLNERLAAHYGVPGVTGDAVRRVQLPPDSPRGGLLTQGTVLAVTSNPTRTSPVKRGLFILDNFLGTPPPPAPPNVPDLEESRKEFKAREPKLSEILAVHRANKLCHSCHSRMDPLGLALENFNVLGGWRETDARQPIDPSGQLITGEKFADIRELKRVLARDRAADIYRCLAEKVFTYALGRSVEPQDAHTLDEIVARLLREGGRFSLLLEGVVTSSAFQKQRVAPVPPGAVSLAAP
ncbi:MAG: DUF1592 domain-containing protein [Verrucomicrobia bacterium]|nr:DUF1592 domain-containing protein [Verrucomicrobiota bacterium]